MFETHKIVKIFELILDFQMSNKNILKIPSQIFLIIKLLTTKSKCHNK